MFSMIFSFKIIFVSLTAMISLIRRSSITASAFATTSPIGRRNHIAISSHAFLMTKRQVRHQSQSKCHSFHLNPELYTPQTDSHNITGSTTTKIRHFNNAGSSPCPPPVTQKIISHLDLESELDGYAAEDLVRESLDNVYASICELIHADDPLEIALVESATVAWTRAFYSMAENVLEGDVMLTSEADYAANVVAMQKLAKDKGARLMVVPSIGNSGVVDVSAFREMLEGKYVEENGDTLDASKIRMVCVTHIPTNSGIVNPVEEIGALIESFNVNHGGYGTASTLLLPQILYLVDACQSVGQMVVDVRKLHCHGLTATGRKYLRGPRGTGFLYVSKCVADGLTPSHVDHFSAPVSSVPSVGGNVVFGYREGARRFEFWESSIALRLGLGAAIDLALEIGIDNIEKQCVDMGEAMRRRLGEMEGVLVFHDTLETNGKRSPSKQCGIVTFSVLNRDATNVQAALLTKGFLTSEVPVTSTPFDSARSGISHNLNRVSLSYFNTLDEVDLFCHVLREDILKSVI